MNTRCSRASAGSPTELDVLSLQTTFVLLSLLWYFLSDWLVWWKMSDMTASWTHSSVALTLSTVTQPAQPIPFLSGWFWLLRRGKRFFFFFVYQLLPLSCPACSSGCFLQSWMSFKAGAIQGWQGGFIFPHLRLAGLSQLGLIMHILSKHWPASQLCHK